MKIKKYYIKILKWADNKNSFTQQELFNEFPELNTRLKEWYLSTFRGAANNNDCLIGVYNDKKGFFRLSLTAMGRSKCLEIKKKWWEKTWIQILFILGAAAGIISLYFNS